ncbi:MAG: hypothetical protein AB7R90_22045 [Reyranellaceae bacterium]
MSARIVQRACDRCTLGVMDADNPHLHGRCACPCHLERLAAALHDAARLAMAADACNVILLHRVPRGEEGRRDLVSVAAYAEMAFSRNAAERELAIWCETCAVPLVLPAPRASEPEPDEEFGAEMLEPAER